MNDLKTLLTTFNDHRLNEIGGDLIDLYRKAADDVQVAHNKLKSAIERRWLAGKCVSENIDIIIDECGSQRAFGERIGITEATISNDKRGYEALKAEGVETLEQLIPFLKQKNIQPNTFSWERMPKLLNEPDAFREKDQRPKDERRLEELYGEIEDIKVRNEGANPIVTELAEDTMKYLNDVVNYVSAQDVFKSTWRNRYYLDFVKQIGWDYITGKQAEVLDPHHTLPDGSSRSPKGKVADVFTIPVNRATHTKIEEHTLKPSVEEIQDALIRTMALFITTHMESDE